jgi:tRNA(fMet)-specific endonuclease VapC
MAKSRRRRANQQALTQFLSTLEILPYDDKAAVNYGQIRSHLEKIGAAINAMEILIGAHARSIPVTLVTNHHRDVKRIPGLRVENWAK